MMDGGVAPRPDGALSQPRFDAFVSYRHDARQAAIARALQQALHRFAKPWYRLRAVRLFRDETNLGARPDLWGAIRAELDRSRFLLLMASPESAASTWVDQEAAHWLATKGADTLLIVVTGGNVAWDPARGAFDPAATNALPPAVLRSVTAEPFWIDLAWVQDPARDMRLENPAFRGAVASIAATLRGTDKDALIGEDLVQRRRAMRLAYGGAGMIGVLAIAALMAAGGFFLQQREAGRQRDQAREALLQSAAREAVLQTRDGRPAQAWTTLQNAVEQARPQLGARPLPARVSEAGLQALIEDRGGPQLSLDLGEASKAAAAANPPYFDEQPGAFSPDGTRVAAGWFHEFGAWRVDTGRPEQAIRLPHKVERVFFHEGGQVVFAAGQVPGPEGAPERFALTALDLGTGQFRTHPMEGCQETLPCIKGGQGPARRLADIRRVAHPDSLARTGAAEALGRDLLVPARSYVGRIQGRFHVALDEPAPTRGGAEGPDKPKLIVFDETTQTIATTRAPGRSAAIARDAPLVLVGSMLDDKLSLFNVVSGGKLAVRPWKALAARDSAGTANLGLDPAGQTLFYSNQRWGTGGGNGRPLSAAVDPASGRTLWTNGFEGRVAFSGDGRFLTQSGLDGTGVFNAETSERLFSLPGFATAFSADSRVLLTEAREPKLDAVPDKAVWRLNEVIPIPSLSRTAALPASTRSMCPTEPSAFRVRADRDTRRWAANDWRRVTDPGILAGMATDPAPTDTPGREFQWRDGVVEVTEADPSDPDQISKPVVKGPVEQVLAQFPEAQGKLRQGFRVSLWSRRSGDGRWTVSMARYAALETDERWTSWSVAPAGASPVASGEMREDDPASGGIFNYDAIGVSFLPRMSAFAVQRSECAMDVFSLPTGQKLGSLALAFSNQASAVAASDDVLAVFSSDWYGGTRSVQLVELGTMAQGPWLMFSSAEQDVPPPLDARAAAAPGVGPLSTLACIADFGFFGDGRYLAIRPGADCAAGKAAEVLEIPPWGRRLRHLLLP